MKRVLRRLRAHLRYLRRPLLQFVPLFLLTLLVMGVGSVCFHACYDKQELNWPEAVFATWSLIFSEPAYPFPENWEVRLFYFVLPPLGLVLILDGIVRFSSHVLRRDETGREWNQAMAATLSGHVILCGLGKLGLRVLQELLRLGEEVIVLEKDEHCPNIAFAQSNGVQVMIGTGREAGILADLNTQRAKSIIIATNDDLANLEMSLDAKRLNPNIRVVLRLFDQELAEKVRESFDVSQAFSTSSLAAPLFATSSSDRSIVNSFYIRDKLLVVANIEIRPGSELIGRKVRDLRSRDGALIVAHERAGSESFFPDGDTALQQGDRISIQTEPHRLQNIHRWNRDPEPY